MTPFFSIIIPTYNRELIIKKAVESVLQQTFSDWQLLIIDDGSTDNTKEIIASYSDKRIQYIYQKNAERSEARNNGIRNSTAQYICFLDSDDYYLPNRLELLHKELEKQNFPVAAFYTGAGHESNGVVSIKKEQAMSSNIFNHLASSAIHSQQVCIHSAILKQFQFNTQFRIGEDMELWLRVADTFPFIYFDNQLTVIIVDQEERTVNVKRNNVYAEYFFTLHYVFSKAHSGNKISENLKKQLLSNCYFGTAKYFIHNHNKWGAVKNLTLAIFSDLFHFQTKYRLRIMLKLLSVNGIYKAQQLIG